MATFWSQLKGRNEPSSPAQSGSVRAVETSFRILLLRAPSEGAIGYLDGSTLPFPLEMGLRSTCAVEIMVP